MSFGTQADLARHLGISRSAVSQAFKKHNIQLSLNGEFDIEYAAWLLQERQDKLKSQAQRSSTKQPAGVKDIRTQREVLRLYLPALIDEAITEFITVNFNNMDAWDGDIDEFTKDMGSDLISYLTLWEKIKKSINKSHPPELTDFELKDPDTLNFDPISVTFENHIECILSDTPN